jgi:murein L,D-transpeptidase YafK
LFFRGFKESGELEVWAADDDGPMRLLKTFPILAQPGNPGPKHREGDLQVPEGVYRIAVFNPESRFHLSLGLNYPNEADRSRVDSRKPGGDIYIHGSAVSIGCLAMGDEAIEQIFLLAYDVKDGGQRELPVHIFPARMTGEAWTALRAKHPQHAAFWSELQPVYDAFEKTKWVPRVQTTKAGRYELAVGDR